MLKDHQSLPMRTDQGKEIEHFFFKLYKKLFFVAVKWNTFESFFYQTIFLTHQVCLFLWCDRTVYGKVGSLFAFSYMIVMILLGGIEGGLIPFFQQFSSSKKIFKKFLELTIIRHLLIIFFCVCFGACIVSFYMPKTFSVTTLFLVALFIITESTKKLFKHLLYLAFYNKYTALVEIVQLILYVSTIWILYFFGIPFCIPLFFLPFIILSFFSSLMYWKLINHYYQTLDDTPFTETQELPSFIVVLKIRAAVLINQICRSLFSGNCIVPLFALYAGFTKAGTMTFIHYLTNTVTFFLYKICIPPAEALLSRIHYFSTATQYHALRLVLTLFAVLTAILGIFLFFNAHSIATLFGYSLPTKTDLFLFFFFIHLLETMFMVYEKFFLVRKKIVFLTVGNLITCAIIFFITKATLPFTTMILGCFFIRFLFFLLLSIMIIISKKGSRSSF